MISRWLCRLFAVAGLSVIVWCAAHCGRYESLLPCHGFRDAVAVTPSASPAAGEAAAPAQTPAGESDAPRGAADSLAGHPGSGAPVEP